MNRIFAFLLLLSVAAPAALSEPVAPRNYYGKIARRVGDMLPRSHVLQHPFDDSISRQAWTNLVTFYDYDRSVFLKSDLEELALRECKLDDEIRDGNPGFGYDVYNLYCRRLKERMDWATNLLLTTEFDFSEPETFRFKRKDCEWPETKEEAEAHWRKRLKNELLIIELGKELDVEEKADKEARRAAKIAAGEIPPAAATTNDVDEVKDDRKPDTPVETMIKRYRQYLTVMTEADEEAVLQNYMSAIARAYDPHSDYLSPASKEDFDMEMNLTLCGVGAVLSMDDGALKISEVMPGGPMDRDGRIKAGDKIIAVKQGDGEFEDVMWQPMKKSIKKIRGKKGTRVTLEIIPRSDPSGATHKAIELVRDEIKLEDQAATGRVERVETAAGVTNRFGYVYLPGFYGTMDKRPSDPDFRSCALDVSKYVADFNAEEDEGLVLDLRGDGGGSLREAVMLSALFAPSGPVVQIKDTRSIGALPIPPANPIAFKKPMVILVDRASASASEIVAAHLRDIGRAIVLGDSKTHGKGTVQSVMGMGPEKYGSMKITTARFYRIDGRSTQVEGVASDIHLPSLLDSMDIGEDKLPNALPFTRVYPAQYHKCWNLDEYLPELKKRSEARLATSARYKKHLENVEGMRLISEREEVSLERNARKAMMKADRDLRELDEDDEDLEEKVTARRRRNQRNRDDVVLDEALQILGDLVRLTDGAELERKTETMDWATSILGF